MKKRYWTSTILVVFLAGVVICGCNSKEEDTFVSVEEIPIVKEVENKEIQADFAYSDMEPAEYAVMKEQEKEPYEKVEVEVEGDKGTIVIGTTGAPYTEILTQVKLLLAKDGWDVQINKYDDYKKMNEDIQTGILDAHLFAHETYMDSYNDVNNTTLTTVDQMFFEMYGVYSKSNQDLTKIEDEMTIAIPSDDTRKARALLFMQDIGWITLKEGVGITAIMDDIVENTKMLQFVEYTPETLMTQMETTDYAIIGADLAVLSGLNIEEDVILAETFNHESAKVFATVLVSTEENVETEKIKLLREMLKSDEIRKYLEKEYRGAYRAMP